jgi:hypothetical protein
MAAKKPRTKECEDGGEAEQSGDGSLTGKAYERELARLPDA